MPRGECFVVNCLTGRRKHSGHLFCFPKTGTEDLKAEWLKALPERERPFDFDKDVVCHLHFVKEQMDTCWNHKVGDKTVETLRQRWRLMVGAVPSVFPDPPKDDLESPVKKETTNAEEEMDAEELKDAEEQKDDEEPVGGELSMLPPGYLKVLANACRPRVKRPTETLHDQSIMKVKKKNSDVSMLPPEYLKMLSIVCEKQTQATVSEAQEQSSSEPKTPPAKSPVEEQVFFMLPDTPSGCELQLETATSPLPESEPASRSATPSSVQDEFMPVVTELESRLPESESEILTAVESVVTVTTEEVQGLDLAAISNQLIVDGQMCEAWTCNMLKDWQSGETVLSCAELVTTHCGAEVQKSIMITNQGSSRIYFRHIDVSSEFASFKCFNYSDVKALLRSIKQAKLCAGLSNCDSVDEFCGGLAINNVWFSENCQQIVTPTERQCRKCKSLWSSLEGEPGAGKRKAAVEEAKPAAMTPDQVRDRLRATLRDQTYLKQRLSRVKKTNTTLLQELKDLRAGNNAKLAEAERSLEMSGLPEKQKLAFTTAVQVANHCSRNVPYSAEWILECNGILRQSNKTYEHLRTRNILPLPTKKVLRKLLKTIPLASAVPKQNTLIAMACQTNPLPSQMSAVAVAEDGTMTTIVLDEAQMQQLLAANNGVQIEEMMVVEENSTPQT